MSKKNIAIVSALGIGDGLMSLVIAHNLKQHGYDVTTFSNHMMQLQGWFPRQTIAKFPAAGEVDTVFAPFSEIISTDGAPLCKLTHQLGEKYKVFYERDFDRSKPVIQNFVTICRDYFALPEVTTDNGIVLPQASFHKYPNRVIIHPMSTSITKNWLPQKFISLARKLRSMQFDPVFTVSPAERPQWENLLRNEFELPLFNNLDELAAFVFNSGYMIGNDSGIGHLAANLGIPTLSLFGRLSVAKLWRPGWGRGEVVTPSWQLPGARLRTHYWQYFLTVKKVINAFKYLSNFI